MGLRGRLAIFFVAITVVPLIMAVGAVQAQITADLRARSSDELRRAGASVAALVQSTRQRAGDLATDLATREGVGAALASPGAADAWLEDKPLGDRADIVVLAAPDGTLRAHRGEAPDSSSPAAVAQRAAAIAAAPGTAPGGVLLDVRVIRPAGLVAAGTVLDERWLPPMAADTPEGSGAALVADGALLAAAGATPSLDQLPPSGRVGSGEVSGREVLVGVTGLPDSEARLVLWTPTAGGLSPLLAFMVLSAAVIAAVLGWLLAGVVVAPVGRAAAVARAVADGDLSRQLSPSGGRELEDLAHALNTMGAELAGRITEVERSRDQLRLSLDRLGEVLSGTLDLDRMLRVVVESAAVTLGADGAAVLLRTAAGDALEPTAVHGRVQTTRLGIHEGVVGHAVRTGQTVRQPGGAPQPARAAAEPQAPFMMVVPLRGRGRTNGALLLVRDEAGGEFDDNDLGTASSIAAGIAVAVENIRLHEETQRLSLTNPVTGLWNNRYFEPQVDAELARARRVNERDGAHREVSVLAVDLDHFGRINKLYDQAAGDAALIEVGRRLQEAIRAPDVVTHPHGEEFAVLLPDTDYRGALRVAERVRAAVARTPVLLPQAGPGGESVELALTCSVGVATFQRHADERVALYRAADRAMQLAKDRGRDRVVGADDLVGAEPSRQRRAD